MHEEWSEMDVKRAGENEGASALPDAEDIVKPGVVLVDADFPGGNIIVESVAGNEVFLRQDLRDTEGHWFYWCFRVRGAAGRTLTFHFTEGNVIGVRGPAVSTDGGETWSWLGTPDSDEPHFSFPFPAEAGEVRFSFTIPYLESNLKQFLARCAGHPHLLVAALCTTEGGRTAERLHLGRLDDDCQHRVLLTCRHHCCEAMASYALEGLMETVLDGTDGDGEWLRGHVEFLAIPFVDKDGVESGDQGKNRRPFDHNRDYAGESRYASVRALRELAPAWSEEKLRVALDLHCPYIRGEHNEVIYFVGEPEEANWQRVGRLSAILESVQAGPLIYCAQDNLPFGQLWNTEEKLGPGKSFCRWAAELPGMRAAATLEIPYANVRGQTVTPESARSFGRDLARALRWFLEEL